MSHGEGLAHLLDAASSKQFPDEFEERIRDTLYVPVVSPASEMSHSMYNDKKSFYSSWILGPGVRF